MDNLSAYLAEQIAFLDEELTADQLAEYAADREALLGSIERPHAKPTIVSIYSVLRKAASGFPSELIAGARDSAAWSLDDSLSRLIVAEIPRMVSRALQLEPMIREQSRGSTENPYLREATRCYLFGLFNAAVALSRSALEHALAREIPKLLQGQSREERLRTLIKAARISILKHATDMCDLADKVRRKANGIIHETACQESEALQILNDTRKFIHLLASTTAKRVTHS